MNPRLPVTGLILCGGQGSRLGGVDKGLHPYEGRPLVEHVLERLAPQVECIIISANRNLDRYRAYGHPVVTDRLGAGPLAGMHAGLAAATTELVVTAPCDSPLLPDSLSSRLWSCLHDTNTDMAVATLGGRLQPVFSLQRRRVLPRLAAALERGELRAMDWFHDAAQVPFDDVAAALANLNSPDDFIRAPVRQP
jgi:molybdopterin-guanine dinucleotide biosynthesis protein A